MQPPSSATIVRRRSLPWAGLALVAMALALRAHRLAAQSLWSDEDITLDRALTPLWDMLRGLPVEQGPLYYALMRPWTLLAGSSDLALRWPSLLASVVAVPVAMAMGGRLAGRRAGRLLGLITAVNPFLVYYGPGGARLRPALVPGPGDSPGPAPRRALRPTP
ncbi:MAG: glycosyltransferase family 39 protein [Ardenticatenia bacterium]|nr:glycosyltransferase family 39 protein [Ardenticatenia bacterium]